MMDRAPALPNLTQRALMWRARLRDGAQAWRLPLTLLGAGLFIGGSWLSFRHLGVSPADLRPGPLLAQLLLTPLSLLYGGIGMTLLARGAGMHIPLRRATAQSSYATLAEILPIPGGALVRAGALIAGGARPAQSWALVLLAAVMWISLAALGCGLTLIGHGVFGGPLLALAGLAGTLASCLGLARMADWRAALLNLGHRLAGLALLAVRLQLAFLCLGVVLPLSDTLPFALANIVGSAASIAPAGLGISESFAAGAAGWVAIAPAAGFLAVGLDRVILLAASALFALATLHWRQEPAQ